MATNFSGAAKNIFRLLNKIDNKRLTPILVGQMENELTRKVRDIGLEVSIIKYPDALNVYDKQLLNVKIIKSLKIIFALYQYNKQLIQYFKMIKPRIVWADNIRTFIFIYFASKYCGCKIIWNIWSEPKGKIAWLLYHVGLFFSDTINLEYKRQGEKIFSKLFTNKLFFKSKTIPIYTGVTDFEKYHGTNIRNELRLPNTDILIMMASNIDVLKGQLDLIKSVELLLDKHSNIKLLIAGSPHSSHPDSIAYDRKLRLYVEKQCLQNNVFFLGWRSDMQDLYRDIDIFVSTSYSESFPDNLRESMLAGKPIIGTNVGGTAEIINEGENGFIIEPGDIKKLVKHIQSLVEDSDKRESMGLKGKLIIDNNFSTKLYAWEFENMVFRSLS
tara:strand:- start:2195 stop:3352 length:1158 start_codon:yes stop_codon:yes gene_type:complete